MIDIVMHRERQLGVGAINRAQRCKDEVWGPAVPANLEDVEKSGEISIEIGVRILQRVAHSGLSGKMHDRSEIAVAKQRCGEPAVGEIEPVKSEVLELAKDGKSCLLERRIVIGVDVSTPTTARPPSSSRRARQKPMKPAAPVIKTASSVIEFPGAKSHQRLYWLLICKLQAP